MAPLETITTATMLTAVMPASKLISLFMMFGYSYASCAEKLTDQSQEPETVQTD